jgi:hypothetical protein
VQGIVLRLECKIPYKELHPMVMCYDLSKTHPERLNMIMSTTNILQEEEQLDIAMANAAVSGATSGLNSCLLNPDGISGESLFKHMVQKLDPNVKEHHPSSYLDIEFSHNQME